jgi:hypothetical protein
MADKKISALTSATTPLAGTEVLPIVQSGATVKVPVSDLTAGRAISATSVTASTGNFVVGTSGQGVDFSATPGTGTSELLADYEEGTWTPTYYGAAGSAGSLAYAEQTGKYTKVGRQVTVTGTIILTNKGSWTGRVQIGGFPFTPSADQYSGQIELRNCTFTGNYVVMEIGRAATTFARFVIVSGLGANTQIEDTNVANNSGFLFTLTYMV